MAGYKVLKSVAHSLGHSFSSDMTYRDGDYALGHLLRRARELNVPFVEVDLLLDSVQPPSFEGSLGARALHRYAEWFPSLVERHGSEMSLVRSAHMRVTFDHSQVVPRGTRFADVGYAPHDPGSPVDVVVTIVDDRGKAWEAKQHSWEYPCVVEPEVPHPSIVQGCKAWMVRFLRRRA